MLRLDVYPEQCLLYEWHRRLSSREDVLRGWDLSRLLRARPGHPLHG
jgi:hypothetical protein